MSTRPTIPPTVALLVYATQAGRCARLACNKRLTEDPFTLTPTNLGQLAHIIGASPDGPRGGADSATLAQDPTNLLLLCHGCHRLIDSHPADYPAEDLRAWKAEHAKRIERLTALATAPPTLIVAFFAAFKDRVPHVDAGDLRRAALPLYALPDTIEVQAAQPGDTDHQPAWEDSLRRIKYAKDRWRHLLAQDRSNLPVLTVFALAPIPALVALGRALTDLSPHAVRVPLKRRDTNPENETTWGWRPPATTDPTIRLGPISGPPKGRHALMIHLSGENPRETLPTMDDRPWRVRELRYDHPQIDATRSEPQREAFLDGLRTAIAQMQAEGATEVHVFAAVPNAIAVALGQAWLAGGWPALHLWDRRPNQGWLGPLSVGD